MAVCNICGGEDFVPGPNDRLARSGAPPRCAGCGSLERHRALRACLDRVPSNFLSWRRAIQFAPDRSLDPAWFRSYEGSSYGGKNSIDLQKIDRPDDSYDFISLSSVLEFVPDDRRAFSELVRIGSEECVVHCTFTPFAADSRHFDAPHGDFGRYHVYGQDLTERFEASPSGLTTLVVGAVDPGTSATEPLHFFCRRQQDAMRLSASVKAGAPAFDASAQAPAEDGSSDLGSQ